MTLTSGALLLFATFCMVALRAFQQQNVIHRYFYWAGCTSYFMAFAEITTILLVVQSGWASALWVGTGGALGVTFAMYMHKRFIQKDAA